MPRFTIGSAEELEGKGFLTGKAGRVPVVVFRNDGKAYAVDDRCPHMGFPLHRGTVEDGLLTCHWHHARFDLASGGTLDPWADDVAAYAVETDGDGNVVVVVEPPVDRVPALQARLDEGLEQGLTLVLAKAVLGLLESGVTAAEIVRLGVRFGTTYRAEGWGAGLTVLTAMANLIPHLHDEDHALALVHGLSFLSGDTRNRAPRFALGPLGVGDVPAERLTSWYRRFIETRSSDAAERALATAIVAGGSPVGGTALVAAATDHVFLDEGHVIDFTNKAFEALDHVGAGDATTEAGEVLPTLVRMTARATRHEEEGQWRHPHDLASLVLAAAERLPERLHSASGALTDDDVSELAWNLLVDDPVAVVGAVDDAIAGGATAEQLGRAVAFASALRITRFHTQNDHGDWDVVHHGFTAANGLHQLLERFPTPELLRGVYHSALKVYLDRFLNLPAARLPDTTSGDLAELQACWDEQGHVDRAGGIVYGFLAAGGDPRDAIAALGHALLAEDPGFHWYQVVEAAVRQFHAWPDGSQEGRLILAGTARFLAAHTPTRRELPQVVRIATRLRRGEPLYEEEG